MAPTGRLKLKFKPRESTDLLQNCDLVLQTQEKVTIKYNISTDDNGLITFRNDSAKLGSATVESGRISFGGMDPSTMNPDPATVIAEGRRYEQTFTRAKLSPSNQSLSTGQWNLPMGGPIFSIKGREDVKQR